MPSSSCPRKRASMRPVGLRERFDRATGNTEAFAAPPVVLMCSMDSRFRGSDKHGIRHLSHQPPPKSLPLGEGEGTLMESPPPLPTSCPDLPALGPDPGVPGIQSGLSACCRGRARAATSPHDRTAHWIAGTSPAMTGGAVSRETLTTHARAQTRASMHLHTKGKAWIAGSSPAMSQRGTVKPENRQARQ